MSNDFQLRPHTGVPHGHGTTSAEQTIGLGISPFWNVHINDQLRLKRPEPTIYPITTKLHVFPVRTTSTFDTSFPQNTQFDGRCVACQLSSINNLGQASKCEGCKKRYDEIAGTDHKSSFKPTVPRLYIPKDSNQVIADTRTTRTRCPSYDVANDTGFFPSSPCFTSPSILSPTSLDQTHPIRRSCGRQTRGLPRNALLRLRAWVDANQHDPYPNTDSKRRLAEECNITEKQVATWFTNTRARKLASTKDQTCQDSEEGKDSQSPFSSIANTPAFPRGTPFSNENPTESHEMDSANVTISEAMPLVHQSSRRGKKKDYRLKNTDESPRLRQTATPYSNRCGPEQGMWQCTFCQQYLTPKSWRRHEETQHRPKYQWVCLATGPRLAFPSPTSPVSLCAFCSLQDPSEEHFSTCHRILECSKKPEGDRTFGRPDHLRQHMKNFHKASLKDHVRDKWRRDGPGKNTNEGWLCGFCGDELKTWDVRETHIANHFKDGLTMASWIDYSQHSPPNEEDANSQLIAEQTQQDPLTPWPEQQLQPQVQFPNTPYSLSNYANIATSSGTSPYHDPNFITATPEAHMMDFNLFDTTDHTENEILFTPSIDAVLGFSNDLGPQFDYNQFSGSAMDNNMMGYQGNWNGQQ